MKSYQVIRTDLSPYQASNFPELESNLISKIKGLNYRKLADAVDQDYLITNTNTQLQKLPDSLLKNTKLILHPNSGYDHFINDRQMWEDIPIVIGHEIRAQAVAEYSLACLFQGLSELPQHISWDKKRLWNRKLIKGLPVWVFGYGHIGQIVADTLSTLGAKVTVVDPFLRDIPHKLLHHWQMGDLKEAEVIIACCSLNKTSQSMFNADFFGHAHPELLFINGARGKLVEEKALKTFLKENPRAFAYLDVFEQEPFLEEWHHLPQVWKTSHIAGVYKNLDQEILNFEEKVLMDFLDLNSNFFMMKYERELLQNKIINGEVI